MMHKILAVIAAAAVAGGIAYAGSSNTNYTSAGTVGFRTTTDGTTNCVGATACNLANITLWDSVAGANGLGITTNNAAKVEGVGAFGAPAGGVTSVQGPATGLPVAGLGTAGTPTGGVLTIQGPTSGGTAVPVSGTLSLTANQSFNLNQITGVAPSATNPLWMADAQTAGSLIQNLSAGATGTGSNLTVTGYASALLTVQCTTACVGTIQGTDASGLFFSVQGYPVNGGAATSAIAGNGQFFVPVNGLTSLRANITANPSSGTVLVEGTAQAGTFPAAGSGGGAVTIANNADVVEGSNTTAHGCSVAFYTVVGCLGQIDDDVKSPIAAGTASIGYLNSTTPFTPIIAAASDNHQTIVTGAHIAMSIHASNHSATVNYLRIYDAASGFNGCNLSTGAVFMYEILPNDSGISIALGGGNGIALANGFSICITAGTTGPSLTDTTVATANAIVVSGSYR